MLPSITFTSLFTFCKPTSVSSCFPAIFFSFWKELTNKACISSMLEPELIYATGESFVFSIASLVGGACQIDESLRFLWPDPLNVF